ncbi:phage minor capsid protein [Lacticaseibacillus salsurivasis]|uniref:phage minor capsid protein n=1 Tax=Lacticaseibacillus salsurivasis TaxID=3081441 RepID=UPI0034480A0C
MYQQIIKETTADVLAGFRTHDQALRANITGSATKALTSDCSPRHRGSLESYARLVVDNTSCRAFQRVRDQAADYLA